MKSLLTLILCFVVTNLQAAPHEMHQFFKELHALHEGADSILNKGFEHTGLAKQIGDILAPCEIGHRRDVVDRAVTTLKGEQCQVAYALVTRMNWQNDAFLIIDQKNFIDVLGANIKMLTSIENTKLDTYQTLKFLEEPGQEKRLIETRILNYEIIKVRGREDITVSEEKFYNFKESIETHIFEYTDAFTTTRGQFFKQGEQRRCTLNDNPVECRELEYIYGL